MVDRVNSFSLLAANWICHASVTDATIKELNVSFPHCRFDDFEFAVRQLILNFICSHFVGSEVKFSGTGVVANGGNSSQIERSAKLASYASVQVFQFEKGRVSMEKTVAISR